MTMADTAMCRGNDWQAINRSRPETCALNCLDSAEIIWYSAFQRCFTEDVAPDIFPKVHAVYFTASRHGGGPWRECQKANPE
jgi:hypothetical protein